MKPRHKLLLLIASIFILPALAYGAWQYGANQLKIIVEHQITEAAGRGQTISCQNLDIRGFPFRIGVHCNQTAFDDSDQRWGFTAGAFRSAAQIYAPGHIISELDGPFQLSTRTMQTAIDWEQLKASTHLDLNEIARFSTEISDANLHILEPPSVNLNLPLSKAHVQKMEIHGRQNDRDFDVAVGLIGLTMQDQDATDISPPLGLELMITAKDQAHILHYASRHENIALKGQGFDIQLLKLTSDIGANISITGDVRFSQSGLVNGVLTIRILNLNQIAALIAQYRPDLSEQINRLTPLLSGLKSADYNGAIELQLNIQNGAVRAGFIPLGHIPAI